MASVGAGAPAIVGPPATTAPPTMVEVRAPALPAETATRPSQGNDTCALHGRTQRSRCWLHHRCLRCQAALILRQDGWVSMASRGPPLAHTPAAHCICNYHPGGVGSWSKRLLPLARRRSKTYKVCRQGRPLRADNLQRWGDRRHLRRIVAPQRSTCPGANSRPSLALPGVAATTAAKEDRQTL